MVTKNLPKHLALLNAAQTSGSTFGFNKQNTSLAKGDIFG